MIRDAFRAALVLAVVAGTAAVVVEARRELVVVEMAGQMGLAAIQRAGVAPPAWQAPGQDRPPEGRLRRLGRAAIDMADAAIGVVR